MDKIFRYLEHQRKISHRHTQTTADMISDDLSEIIVASLRDKIIVP